MCSGELQLLAEISRVDNFAKGCQFKIRGKSCWGTFPSYAIVMLSRKSRSWHGLKGTGLREDTGEFRKSGRQFDQPYVAYGVLGASKPFLGNPTVEPELGFGLINRN
ncbi:MAG: hypothetical protein ACLU4J_17820 [Butyricimonas paravirosa]